MGALPSKPASPPLTEHNIGDQSGKACSLISSTVHRKLTRQSQVLMITGSTSGIGSELASILYSKNATVYIVARSRTKIDSTISQIHTTHPTSTGKLESIIVDFNDLTTIKLAAEEFLRKEQRLDVLWNNAGIMIPAKGSKTKQNYEAQLGVNALAPFLFTKLLTERLIETAESSPQGSTRVIWVSSSAAANFAPQGGVDLSKLANYERSGFSQWQNYGVSKAANILQSYEFHRRYSNTKIVSVAIDPGNLDTGLYQNMPKWQLFLAKRVALKPAKFGAYTELFAGLSEDVKGGSWCVPWGKADVPRKDIAEMRLSGEEGGSDGARKFWEWCEKEVKAYE